MRLVVYSVLVLLFGFVLSEDIPVSFDVREQWPECVTPILNQGHCGSCWAFSASTSMSARFCIATKGKIPASTTLSPQYLVSCDASDHGCHGGDTLEAYNFMQTKGQDLLNCTKYTSGETQVNGICPSKCDDGGSIDDKKLFFGVDHYSLIVPGNIEETVKRIQRDLMTHGPISASFAVFSDFTTFFNKNPKGIYRKSQDPGRSLGGHAVRLVGWGEENGTKYWTLANSWGTEWGTDGYFRMVRGEDNANIESRRLTAGIPKSSADQVSSKPNPVDDVVKDGALVKIPVDAEVLEIARFSLAEMKQKKVRNAPSAFFGVEEAYAQVTNGITYHLKISVGDTVNSNDSSTPSSIDVIVHRTPKDNLILKSQM